MKSTIPYFPANQLVRYSPEASSAMVSYRGYTVESFLKAFRECGPIFKTEVNGMEEIVFGGLEANDLAWRNPDNWSYQEAVSVFREELSELHLTQLDKEAHRRKRRLLNKGFKNTSVMAGMSQMAETIEQGLSAIEGQSVELHEALMKVFTRAQSVTAVKTPLSDAAIERMVDFEEGFIGALFLNKEERAFIYNRADYLSLKRTVLGELHAIVKERMSGVSKDDLLDSIINQKTVKSIEPLTEEELIYDTYLLLIAGTGNTSKTICYALYSLAQDPELTGRLREELKGFHPGMLAGGMKDFPLLKATIMEAERLYPAAPVLPRVPAKPLDFMGFDLEPGDHCLHMISLMHYDDTVYEDPFRFIPQRWIDNDYPKLAHGTFGGGSHVCLGMNVARIQMPIVLGYLLSQYEFEIEKSPVVENYAYPGEVDSQTVRMHVKIRKQL